MNDFQQPPPGGFNPQAQFQQDPPAQIGGPSYPAQQQPQQAPAPAPAQQAAPPWQGQQAPQQAQQQPPAPGGQWPAPPPAQQFPAPVQQAATPWLGQPQQAGGQWPGQAPAQQGFAPPGGYGMPEPNLDDPRMHDYGTRTPFIPFAACEYQVQLLDFRHVAPKQMGGWAGYQADVRVLSASHANPTFDEKGQPVMPAVAGSDYVIGFQLNATGANSWQNEKSQKMMVAMFEAIVRQQAGSFSANDLLRTLTNSSPEELQRSPITFRINATIGTSRNGKPFTRFDFLQG